MKICHGCQSASLPLVRRFSLLMAAVCVTTFCSGCNVVILLGYLIGGPPSIEPDFDKQTEISLQGTKKKVAVVCNAPKELMWDHSDLDDDLQRRVSYLMFTHDIQVVDPNAVQNWLDTNSDWDTGADIGVAFEADYVVYIDLESFSLYEVNVNNLYRGRTQAIIRVYEMTGETGNVIYEKELVSKYPIRAPESTFDISRERFSALYMSYLSEQIGRLFYEHYAGDDIPHGMLQ